MAGDRDGGARREISGLARPLRVPADLDPLLEAVGDARFVLLGEASHGTAEYYGWRAEISRRLIGEHGFSFVAVEGDWPDCFRVNRWAKGRAQPERSAAEVLGAFDRWPTWMWANEEVAHFAGWLRQHNRETGGDVGFYGLDVYSLWDSLRAVLDHVSEHDPGAVDAAHRAYRCFEPYGEASRRGHRAIGVVYDPRLDPYGNWVPSVVGRRYDAWLWFPDTEAVHPLHMEAAQRRAEHETVPWGT